jgi:dATP pyrophosphohydrolase
LLLRAPQHGATSRLKPRGDRHHASIARRFFDSRRAPGLVRANEMTDSPTASPAEVPRIGPKSPVIRVFDCHVARPVAGGVYEYLLLERSSHKIYAKTWRMVGGKLHSDETAWQGCLRELAEETRLPVERLLCVPYVNRFYEWKHDRINDIPVFVAVTRSGANPVLDDEHSAFAWLSLDSALERLPWPGQADGLRAADTLLRTGHVLQEFMEVSLER